jgi:hypothetical protein
MCIAEDDKSLEAMSHVPLASSMYMPSLRKSLFLSRRHLGQWERAVWMLLRTSRGVSIAREVIKRTEGSIGRITGTPPDAIEAGGGTWP